MNPILRRCSAVVLAALALSACATPEPVRDLASKTAANVTQVGGHLKALGDTAESIARARARNVARLKATVGEVRSRHSLDIALIKKTGDAASLTKKNDILAWMTEARAAARGMTVEEFEKAQEEGAVDPVSAEVRKVMDSLESLDPKTQTLDQVGKTLAALSQKDDVKARARFLVGYVKEVRAGVDEKQKAAAEAAMAAKSTAENATNAAAAAADAER